MPDPILYVNRTPPVPVTLCESRQHLVHPGETCAELEALRTELRARLDEIIHAAFDLADERWITGCGTGEARGLLPSADRVPTPVDRALSILAPHLATIPLYRPNALVPGARTAARWT